MFEPCYKYKLKELNQWVFIFFSTPLSNKFKTVYYKELVYKISKEIRNEIKNEYKSYCREIEKNCFSGTKNFLKFTKIKNKKNNFPSTMFFKNKLTNKSCEIANLFSEHFNSVYTNPKYNLDEYLNDSNYIPNLYENFPFLNGFTLVNDLLMP